MILNITNPNLCPTKIDIIITDKLVPQIANQLIQQDRLKNLQHTYFTSVIYVECKTKAKNLFNIPYHRSGDIFTGKNFENLINKINTNK